MNEHKLLTKFAVLSALALGTGAVGTNITAQTVNASKTTKVHYGKKAVRLYRAAKQKFYYKKKYRYYKDLQTYHLRKGIKSYVISDYDIDDDDFTFHLKTKSLTYYKSQGDGKIIAPSSSHTKYELKTVDEDGHPVKARPITTESGASGFILESKFHKLFATGGRLKMPIGAFINFENDKKGTTDADTIVIIGHRVYGPSKWVKNALDDANTPERLAKALGYKSVKQMQEATALYEIQNEELDATDKWVDFSPETGMPMISRALNDHEVARINKALKKFGYSDSLINKIWKFQRYRLDYPDTHDDYDTPYLINYETHKSKFLLD